MECENTMLSIYSRLLFSIDLRSLSLPKGEWNVKTTMHSIYSRLLFSINLRSLSLPKGEWNVKTIMHSIYSRLLFSIDLRSLSLPKGECKGVVPRGTEAYRPICTIKMEISEGETPLMRLACPNVRGLTRANFWRASLERDLIC